MASLCAPHIQSGSYCLSRAWPCASPRAAVRCSRRHSSSSSRRSGPLRSAPSDVLVLDFDGVLVDSETEVTASAIAAAQQHWPQLFRDLSAQQQQELRTNMRRVRPVLVRGYESMVMARMLREDPGAVDLILGDWSNVLPAQLCKYNEDSEQLHAVFEGLRNHWMKEQTESWMQLQQPFPGVVDSLHSSPFPIYFATSKAGHRVAALMNCVMGLDLKEDSPRLFASLLPPEEAKAGALRLIQGRPVCEAPGTALHFVDDRLDTLLAVAAHEDLGARWKLYLASWGYCTADEVERARSTPGVRVLELRDFHELLRFGLVMRTDDGCEPTREEVEQGVA